MKYRYCSVIDRNTRVDSLNGKAPDCNSESVAARGGSNPSRLTSFPTTQVGDSWRWLQMSGSNRHTTIPIL